MRSMPEDSTAAVCPPAIERRSACANDQKYSITHRRYVTVNENKRVPIAALRQKRRILTVTHNHQVQIVQRRERLDMAMH